MESNRPALGWRFRAALVVVLLAAACTCEKPPPPPAPKATLASLARVHFAERDAKLRSYRFSGVTREAGQTGAFEFSCRAPNKVRGELKSPQHRTFSFDGQRLFDVDHDAKTFTAYELKLSPERAALTLMQTFAPFAPEGFRVPFLLQHGLEAKTTTHPRASDAVELSLRANDGAQPIAVTYVMRWPSMDFLEKRVTYGGNTSVLRVDDEQCDAKLALCFPKKLTNVEGGKDVATTELSNIEINPEVPNDAFTLAAPEGYTSTTHQLVDAESSIDGGR